MQLKFTRLSSICVVAAGALLYGTLSSNSAGITGRSTVGCGGGGCHGSSSSTTVLSITGIPGSGWVAGTAYTITATVTNTTKTAAGFDITVNAGTLSGASAGATASGTEARHTQPKTFVSNAASWTFTWTAPASGSSVVFSMAGNAVNLNGSADAGDVWNTSTTTFNAAATAAVPTATTTAATATGANGATLNGSINANGASTTVTFDYGTTTAYGSSANATPSPVTGTTATPVSAAITGLAPATVYHYRVKAVSSAGTTNGADMTFTTSAGTAAPAITLAAVTGISNTTATINGTVNANNSQTTFSVQYGLTTAYGATATATPGTATGATPTAFSASLSSLAHSSIYHYRVVATNSLGNTTNSPDATFTTGNLAVNTIAAAGYRMYPNPAYDVLMIDATTATVPLTFLTTDAFGKAVPAQVSRNGNTYSIGVGGLAAGIYFLRMSDGTKVYSSPFMKQ